MTQYIVNGLSVLASFKWSPCQWTLLYCVNGWGLFWAGLADLHRDIGFGLWLWINVICFEFRIDIWEVSMIIEYHIEHKLNNPYSYIHIYIFIYNNVELRDDLRFCINYKLDKLFICIIHMLELCKNVKLYGMYVCLFGYTENVWCLVIRFEICALFRMWTKFYIHTCLVSPVMVLSSVSLVSQGNTQIQFAWLYSLSVLAVSCHTGDSLQLMVCLHGLQLSPVAPFTNMV